jgi:hypothetical protein
VKIKNQVTNLEISQKLKELGVPQESLFYWVRNMESLSPNSYGIEFDPDILPDGNIFDIEYNGVTEPYSAFTVAELGEIIPIKYLSLIGRNVDGTWYLVLGYAGNIFITRKSFYKHRSRCKS